MLDKVVIRLLEVLWSEVELLIVIFFLFIELILSLLILGMRGLGDRVMS